MVKIVFCLPGREYSRESLMSWTDLMNQCNAKGHQCMVSQNYSPVVHFSRSKCLGADINAGTRQVPFQGNVDYDVLMWIDSDIVFQPKDVLALLESPHDVTAGYYLSEDLQTIPAFKAWDEEYFVKNGMFEFLTVDTLPKDQYVQVAYSGMGFMMIRKGVVEKLEYPWFRSDVVKIGERVDILAEDFSFCRAMTASGTNIHLDTTVRVGHQKKVIL